LKLALLAVINFDITSSLNTDAAEGASDDSG